MLAYFKGKSFVSRLIKWRTWGQYSHVAWIVDRDFTYRDSANELQTVEKGTIYESWHRKKKAAPRNGVRKGIAGDLHKPGTEVDLEAIELSDAHYQELILFFERKAADPRAKYGFRGVLAGFSLRKNSAHGKYTVFCSQLLMQGFAFIKFRLLKNIDPAQTSPVDMSHSPAQSFVATWHTGTPLPNYNLPDGLR